MNIHPIREQLLRFREEGKTMFATSSFQTQSLPLLHIISRTDPDIPVYFINTGYHFPETIVHKNKVASILGLKVIDLWPLTSKHLQKSPQGNLLFTFDPDYCCYLNKVQPVETLLSQFDIWINGIRADQSRQRSTMEEFQATAGKALRYHPMLKWTMSDIENYINDNGLPRHPMEALGYKSIGCEPCTRPVNGQQARDGRWFGMTKTECGLNTDQSLLRKNSK